MSCGEIDGVVMHTSRKELARYRNAMQLQHLNLEYKSRLRGIRHVTKDGGYSGSKSTQYLHTTNEIINCI